MYRTLIISYYMHTQESIKKKGKNHVSDKFSEISFFFLKHKLIDDDKLK